MTKTDATPASKTHLRQKAGTAPARQFEIPERPHMPEAIASWLEARLRDTNCFLEYGSGGSTRLAASLDVPHIVSVESDRAFAKAVRAAIDRSDTKSDVSIVHVDVGPTQDWGYPANFDSYRSWPNYSLGVWDFLRAQALVPDLILIDGRFRLGCLFACLLEAPPGTRILFDDYADRKEVYGMAEKLFLPSEMVDRSAVFVVPDKIRCRTVARALGRFVILPD